LRGINHRSRLLQGLYEGQGIARLVELPRPVVSQAGDVHSIPRQLEIHRSLDSHGGVQDAIDLRESGRRVIEHRRRDGEFLEDAFLRIELPHLVMQQWILVPLTNTGRAADHHHG